VISCWAVDSFVRSAVTLARIAGPLAPIEVACAVHYFASDQSRKTTGQVLAVESGFTMS